MDHLAAWALGVSLIALILPFFHSELWDCLRRPRLDAELEDLHTTSLTSGGATVADCIFTRLIVSARPRWGWANQWIGYSVAREVEVFADALLRNENGVFVPVATFPRMDLKWSHVAKSKQDIGQIPKSCDLGRLTGPYADWATPDSLEKIARDRAGLAGHVRVFTVETEVAPNHARHVLPPATYHLRLKIAAANAQTLPFTVGIWFTGDWFKSLEDVESKVLRVFRVD